MAQIQIEATIQAHSTVDAGAGNRMAITAGIVVPATPHFRPLPKASLKVASMDVTPTRKE